MNFIHDELEELKREGLYRELKVVEGGQGNRVKINGKEVILLSSNNYLGLASHPELKKAAVSAVEKYGCGSGASRLISGNMELHERLEERIASFKGTESALLFNSGYTANVGAISSICGRGDIIFSDKLNHASIIDGCLLSGAEIKRYPHKDIDALERFLKSTPTPMHRCGGRKRLIITDGVFSMDGDIAPLNDIIRVAKQYSAFVMVDDAHATGVLGEKGKGTAEHLGVDDGIDIVMGTFSKALGSFGGFVAVSTKMREFLINRARSFIYTTSLPPPVIASSIAAIDIAEKGYDLRSLLWKNIDYLKNGLKGMGFDIMDSQSQIIPIFIGDESRTMEMSRMLLEEGVFVHGIRPPTVPHGKSRLRVTVTAAHKEDDINMALEAFKTVGKKMRVI